MTPPHTSATRQKLRKISYLSTVQTAGVRDQSVVALSADYSTIDQLMRYWAINQKRSVISRSHKLVKCA